MRYHLSIGVTWCDVSDTSKKRACYFTTPDLTKTKLIPKDSFSGCRVDSLNRLFASSLIMIMKIIMAKKWRRDLQKVTTVVDILVSVSGGCICNCMQWCVKYRYWINSKRWKANVTMHRFTTEINIFDIFTYSFGHSISWWTLAWVKLSLATFLRYK